SMFMPGFVRTIEKIRKAKEEEVGFAGSTATMDDIWLGLLGIRPYRMDTSSDKFLVDNLRGFSFRSRDISSAISESKQAKRTPEEQAREVEKVDAARKRMEKDYAAT